MPEAPGFGTTWSYGTTQGGSFTPFAEVVDLTPPKYSCDDIETTHMTSTNKWKTFQAGLKDAGEGSLTIHWDKTLYATVHNTLLFADYFHKITFNDGTTPSTLVFAGYVKEVGPETPLDDIVTVELTVKASGEPVFTAGT